MKVLVTNASGAFGRQLVPRLITAGHTVLRTALDVLDAAAVREAVQRTRSEVIVHQATALCGNPGLSKADETSRMHREGTDNLLAAAKESGVRRFVLQSYAVDTYASRREDDPLGTAASLVATIRYVEQAVASAEGIEGLVLRYGDFYGPGTSLQLGEEYLEMVRKRRFPITWRSSFIHVADAARATVAAVERGAPGIYDIVEDGPVPKSEWLPVLARAARAKPPRRVPPWLGGESVTGLFTENRDASNAKAKRELGWEPQAASWRDGFTQMLQP
ncbi:NAD-dependent epimerase/dehydratase family protein [Actinomadura rudentiformis]|uniref:NAD(P)-dependent oxidoreductase n=1 Tax=Actinomadura rudentiformis TaxID=359158 RepID=A0A6H9YTP4_9ACTN|nr:NAD(P)-dependent oxidoreductase [Actinomadura rudentiformis]KAB2350241.1 NAD(P)-dependent oxidoreductase [Actinomadura rudentiformis]